jgi:hypothetical protein
VQEVLTFCIGGTASGSNNACPTNTSVTLSLGTGTPRVVGSTSNAAAVSQPFIPISPGPYTDTTQALYSYIETNALSGVVINIKVVGTAKYDSTCSGLYNTITPFTCSFRSAADNSLVNTSLTSSNSAQFGALGILVQPQYGVGANTFGTLSAAGSYNSTGYYLGTTANITGATGTGETIMSSTGPVYQKTSAITFGAIAGAATTAGSYTNVFGFIATGTF